MMAPLDCAGTSLRPCALPNDQTANQLRVMNARAAGQWEGRFAKDTRIDGDKPEGVSQ
ncbi:MAG: hypothetical protein J2P54_22930 [Bradyrhizobiaceae bacterium]|nr:hypothetical protein [Bradyrhizobiaceae bacterium]